MESIVEEKKVVIETSSIMKTVNDIEDKIVELSDGAVTVSDMIDSEVDERDISDEQAIDELLDSFKEFSDGMEQVQKENAEDSKQSIKEMLDALEDYIDDIRQAFNKVLEDESSTPEQKAEANKGIFSIDLLDNSSFFIEKFNAIKNDKLSQEEQLRLLTSRTALGRNIANVKRLSRRFKIKKLKLDLFLKRINRIKHSHDYVDNVVIFMNIAFSVIYNVKELKEDPNIYRLFMVLILKLVNMGLALRQRLKVINEVANHYRGIIPTVE